AGNVIGDFEIGSVEYASEHLNYSIMKFFILIQQQFIKSFKILHFLYVFKYLK
ncbi:hypothetical protein Q604_UNBC12464G0001, partial [human gut metagenome]